MRLDRVVERPRPLNGAVREAPGERAVALVERSGLGAQHAVGVRVVLEDPPHDGERDPPGRRDGAHRSPRRHASTDIRLPAVGLHLERLERPVVADPRAPHRDGPPSSSARAPMCGLRARTTRTSSAAGRSRSSYRSAAPIFSA